MNTLTCKLNKRKEKNDQDLAENLNKIPQRHTDGQETHKQIL